MAEEVFTLDEVSFQIENDSSSNESARGMSEINVDFELMMSDGDSEYFCLFYLYKFAYVSLAYGM